MLKKKATSQALVPVEIVERRILFIRGHKVILDADLAALYEVPTRALNQAVRRNIERFPEDCMFQLNQAEFENWRSQIVMSNLGAKMGLRRSPYAFTEQGVAMLSSVLKSKRAIAVNIAIMRTFVRLRRLLATHRQLAERLAAMEKKFDDRFKAVFDILRQLMELPPSHRSALSDSCTGRGNRNLSRSEAGAVFDRSPRVPTEQHRAWKLEITNCDVQSSSTRTQVRRGAMNRAPQGREMAENGRHANFGIVCGRLYRGNRAGGYAGWSLGSHDYAVWRAAVSARHAAYEWGKADGRVG
jgi:hypothetical protein